MSSDTHMNRRAAQTPCNFVLVGSVGCGKTALMHALLNKDGEVLKTQAAIFHGDNVIDTPGEFVSRRNYFGALVATLVDVQTIVYLQAANSDVFAFPAGLLRVYPEKHLVGVISKVDLPDADIEIASTVLKENGIAEPFFSTSTATGFGICALRNYLVKLCQNETQPSSKRENVA